MTSVIDPIAWNTFVLKHAPRSGAFLQMWEWGIFQEASGWRVHRLAQNLDGRTTSAAQLVERRLPFFGRYLYCPRGPVGLTGKEGEQFLREAGAARRALFVRADPAEENRASFGEAVRTLDVQPTETLLLNLSESSETLLKEMH